MLRDCPTRCTLPVQDLERARRFYEQILGLAAVEEFPDGGINYNAGGTRITLVPSRTPPAGDHSQLGFDVQDIRAVINSLESKGVQFEDYDMPGFTPEGHLVNIAPYNCAWFKDSEGNSLAIWEPDSAPSGAGMLMFGDCTTEANLPADDMKRARRFYEEMLGFKALEVFADGVEFELRGQGRQRPGAACEPVASPQQIRGGRSAWISLAGTDCAARSTREVSPMPAECPTNR